jgi:signal transduction histidine kinase
MVIRYDEPMDVASSVDAIQKIDVVKKILEVICRTTGMGFSAVARVTDQKWIACAVRDEITFGLVPGGELELRSTICDEIRQDRRLVVIDHVALDDKFCDHHTPRRYGFQSYVSVPITLVDGRFFGTLCAIDPKPAKVNTPEVIGMFTLFADLIAQHLDMRDRAALVETALLNERKIAGFRDQFAAVLGHDLRNPLNAILTSAELLKVLQPTADTIEFVSVIQRCGRRMAELIENVLDFSRGSMGGGLGITRSPQPNLQKILADIIQELRIFWPARQIDASISLAEVVSCDAGRISQVLSNLLANALTHGAPDRPVRVVATSGEGAFELSVANEGPAISPDIMEKICEPFSRGKAQPGAQGLGLGLYIATQIAKSHGGSLTVISTSEETRFTLRMPTA